MVFGGSSSGNFTRGRPVRAALIGAGDFGSGIASQTRHVPALSLCAVADADLEAARRAAKWTGLDIDRIAICESERQARQALEAGQMIATADAAILFDLAIDVVVEATGIAEAGALHASRAISSGKHVAMVNKEADAAVGPILKYLADQAGVVYTAVDGDQHGLLIGMVRWAREIGLDILCAGKALDGDLVVENSPAAIRRYGTRLDIVDGGFSWFQPITAGAVGPVLAERKRRLGEYAGARPWDMVELTIVANATGFDPDTPQSHCPAVWPAEIPLALCPADRGGILDRAGVVECVQVLRAPHDLGLQGGVFLVVSADSEQARRILIPGYTLSHPKGATSLVTRPHHLLGIEAIHSILAAAQIGQPTGAIEYLPRFDVVYRARRSLAEGSVIGGDHDPNLDAEIVPATPISPGSPLPAGLAQGNRLRCDVPAGSVLTAAMIEPPKDSALWRLRGQQDAHFAGG